MDRVKLLDCTLRDGGYVNNWNFKEQNISDILFRLAKSNVDIIECGFMIEKPYDKDYSLFSSIKDIDNILIKNGSSSVYVAMIAIGEKDYNPELLCDCKYGNISGIRLTFRTYEIDKAFKYAEIIKSKGYRLYMQPVGTTGYSDGELVDLIQKINKLKPYVFSIVDTLGTMNKRDLTRMLFLIDHNLDNEIILGFHSHNNLQMSLANAQAFIEYDTSREIIIDCTTNGMGRGAGNLCTELIMDYINNNFGYKYNILPIIEITDEYLVPIYLSSPWGYTSAYSLSATKKCHPNYASYLLTKHSIPLRAISHILDLIPLENRLHFNKEIIEKLYIDYQDNCIDDIEIINNLRKKFDSKNIIAIAPGYSLKTHLEEIKNYIKEKNAYVIALNFIPENIDYDMVFIGNRIRYEKLKSSIDYSKTILTSNIKNLPQNAIVVNYSELTNSSMDASDSTGIMFLKLLSKVSVKNIDLAGFDGFNKNQHDNYFSNIYAGSYDSKLLEDKQKAIIEQIKKISKEININYITPSKYLAV